MHEVSPEISSNINPHWENLRRIEGGFVAVHTWLVLWWSQNYLNHLLSQISDEEQNILLWAILLHDIRKLGPPVYVGKDHVHPFKSAAAVLEVFQ